MLIDLRFIGIHKMSTFSQSPSASLGALYDTKQPFNIFQ